MSEIAYNFPALQNASERCGNAAKNMTGQLDDLKRSLQPLLATWGGDAQAAYQQRQSEWETAANDLRDLLTKIQNALHESAVKMQQREQNNMKKFQ